MLSTTDRASGLTRTDLPIRLVDVSRWTGHSVCMATAELGCVVRPAGLSDLHAVLAVHAQRDAAINAPVAPSAVEQATWERMMASPDLVVYLAELHGEPVGTASSMVMPNVTYGCAPTAFIEAVVVIAHQRRRGIASQMIQRILADTREAGCNKVQLLSHKRHSTDGAHRLYSALGFEPEAEGFRLYHGTVPDAVLRAAERGT